MARADILGSYEEMLGLSQKMLALAKTGDWDLLAEPEKERAAIVERLRQQDEVGLVGLVGLDAGLSGTEEQQARLIRGILAADAEIMALSESRILELHEELRASGNEYKLSRAYGTR